ncbi:MAG: hypothetical protein WCI18_12760 [Pseudomonadota bacterium]
MLLPASTLLMMQSSKRRLYFVMSSFRGSLVDAACELDSTEQPDRGIPRLKNAITKEQARSLEVFMEGAFP